MKTVKITLLDVIEAKQIAEEVGQLKFRNPKITYRFGKALRQIKAEVKEFDERRNELVVDAGMPEQNSPEFIKFQESGKLKELENKVDELLDEEVELRVAPIPYDLVANEEPGTFSVKIFLTFWFMFEDEEDDNKDNEDGPSEQSV